MPIILPKKEDSLVERILSRNLGLLGEMFGKSLIDANWDRFTTKKVIGEPYWSRFEFKTPETFAGYEPAPNWNGYPLARDTRYYVTTQKGSEFGPTVHKLYTTKDDVLRAEHTENDYYSTSLNVWDGAKWVTPTGI